MSLQLVREDYLAWEKSMGFDGYGGRERAAEALGVTVETVRRLRQGKGSYTRQLALAMMALKVGLPPWPGAGRPNSA